MVSGKHWKPIYKNRMEKFNHTVFDQFPILKSDRLSMRDIRPEDAEAIYKMRSNGRVNQFIPRPLMPT